MKTVLVEAPAFQQHILVTNSHPFRVLPNSRRNTSPPCCQRGQFVKCTISQQPPGPNIKENSLEWQLCVDTAIPGHVMSICLQHDFKYLYKLEKRGKKCSSRASLLFHFVLKITLYWMVRKWHFSLGLPLSFFCNLLRARPVSVHLGKANSLRIRHPAAWIRHLAAYCLRLAHRRSECVCVGVCVCVSFRTGDSYTHCWFCRIELL